MGAGQAKSGCGRKFPNLNTWCGERGSWRCRRDRGLSEEAPPALACLKPGLSGEGQDLAEPGSRNNVRQVPAKLRERPRPVSLSALSQVQKSNLLVTPPAPLGNFLNSSDLSYP